MIGIIESSLEHAVIALVIQLMLIYWLGAWGAGAVAVAISLSREIAQNEYKLALTRGWEWGDTPPVKWHEGLTTGWSVDGLLDVLLPVFVCAVVAMLWKTIFR